MKSMPSPRVTGLLALLATVLVIGSIYRHHLFARRAPAPASMTVREQMRYYSRRVNADPADVDAYVALGRLDCATGYYTDCVRHLRTAQALARELGNAGGPSLLQRLSLLPPPPAPPAPEMLIPLGRSLTFLAHYREAEATLLEAVQRMPTSLDAALALAELRSASPTSTPASQPLRDYLKRNPELEPTPLATQARLTTTTTTAQPATNDPAAKSDVKSDIAVRTEQLMIGALQANDRELATHMAEALLRIAPDNVLANRLTADALLTRHNRADLEQASSRLRRVVSTISTDAGSHYALGLALYATGHPNEALREWERCVTLDPDALEAIARIASYHESQHDWQRAAMARERIALRDSARPSSVHAATLACARAGASAHADYWRSREAILQHQFPAALTFASHAFRRAETPHTDAGLHRMARLAMADAYQGMNRRAEYLQTLKSLAASNTLEDELILASAYDSADRLEEEIATLRRALNADPTAPARIHALLAQVALRKGRHDDAEAELRICTSLRPNNPDYHLQLGNLYLERRNEASRLQRAIQEFDAALHLDETEVSAYQRRGLAYEAAGDLHRAIRDLEHALDLLPGEGATYQALGRLYTRSGDRASGDQMLALYRQYVAYDLQAQSLLSRARAANQDTSAQLAMARFLEQSGDYAASLRYYRLASQLRPKDASLRAQLKQATSRMAQDTSLPMGAVER